MWSVSGRGGCVYTLSDEYGFDGVPLEQRNDGWDWLAPESLRCWLDEPTFEVFEGGRWRTVQPERTYLKAGYAVFSRCMYGHVRASGSCLPASRIAEVGRWQAVVEAVVPVGSVMGGPRVAATRQLGATASLDVNVEDSGSLYTWLPHGGCVLVGVGVVGGDGLTIIYDEQGVSYVPCS